MGARLMDNTGSRFMNCGSGLRVQGSLRRKKGGMY